MVTSAAQTSPTRELADRVFAYRLDVDWFTQARRGLPIEHLRADTADDIEADAAFARTVLTELRWLPTGAEDDRLTAGFLGHVLTGWVARARYPDLGFTATSYGSFFVTMALQQVFKSHTGTADGYRSLVADHRDQVREISARLQRQREAGVLIPRPALDGVRESLRRVRTAASQLLEASAPAEARDGVARIVEREVLPAYDIVLELVDDGYAAHAPETVGLAQYPPVRSATGPLSACTRRVISPRSRYTSSGSSSGLVSRRKSSSRACGTWRRSNRSSGIGFSVLPQAPYGLKRLDPQNEAGMTYGFYEPTAAEPVGRYRWNGANLEQVSMLTYAALIFHELAPGHHFHLARQAENTALPDIRRECLDIGAFNEGWAEYAAALGSEMGLYDDPLDAYGILVHERFTAQRLVDTGLNLYGWTLQQAAQYMREHTTESDGQIGSEVLRYSTDLPAQPLASRAGFIELNRIRAKASTALSDAFDIRDFHEHVLGPGALPFPVIEGHVDRWTAATQSSRSSRQEGRTDG